MTFLIEPFQSTHQSGVIELIEHIQMGEFDIPIDEGQRKGLNAIPATFQKGNGNYWVALFNHQIIGTMALLDIGHHEAALRDVFVHEEYRGKERGFAKQLLDVVLEWAKAHNIRIIYLGTTLAFRAAHRFYEKHQFEEIPQETLPPCFPVMEVDKKFFRYNLSSDQSFR